MTALVKSPIPHIFDREEGGTVISKRHEFNRVLKFFAVGLQVIMFSAILFGCGEDKKTTAPTASTLTLSKADVLVDGESVNGKILPRDHGMKVSTRFEAVLTVPDGVIESGAVWIHYERPGRMSMMHDTGTFMLHDDGTHGDLIPNDGEYCYEDSVGTYGCHGMENPEGEYQYNCYGVDEDGHETNHINLRVTLVE